jgi:hypothetical protein
MSTNTITQFSEVIAAVVLLAEEKPNQTADDLYFDRAGKPCCIFGHAFARLGLSADDVTDAVDHDDDYSIAALNLHALGIEGVMLSQKLWATAVQKAQDRGSTWQEAVTQAGSVPA